MNLIEQVLCRVSEVRHEHLHPLAVDVFCALGEVFLVQVGELSS